MYRLLMVAVVALSALTMPGQAPVYHHHVIPDRPARLKGEWKGEPYPVVGFVNTRPVVLADGKKRTIDLAKLSLSIADGYAPGFVTVTNTEAQSWEIHQYVDGHHTSSRPGWSRFSAELVADRDLADVYVALIVFEAGEEYRDAPPALAIMGLPVGKLAQGTKRRVSGALPALNSQKKIAWAALVFCSEGQVRSSGPERIVSVFFDRLERHVLAKTINERILAGVDAPLRLLRHLPVEIEGELREKYRGQTVQTRLYVGIDGAVEALHLIEPRDVALQRLLEPQLKNWLFVPPMQGGLIVRQQVALPLKL